MPLKNTPYTQAMKALIINGMILCISIVLLPTIPAFAHGMSEAEKASAVSGGYLQYIWLGATHMLTGYDHLAFVFGIIFFLKSFKDIAKYITAFTIGHSITLIFATLNGIQLNHYLIDAIIALSVCYIAFHNLGGFQKLLHITPPNMLVMIFSLGLIHGFGLSTILQGLPLDQDHLLGNIISFNIGIELGQLAALALMLICLALWRQTGAFQLFSKLANGLLIIAGIALFFMQIQAYITDQSAQKTASLETRQTTNNKTQKHTKEHEEIEIKEHTATITVPAKSGIEYKVLAKKGAVLSYSWQTKDDAALYFDFHGEPAGDHTDYYKSYKIATDKQDQGSQTLPFEGTHGWYWKNESAKPVLVELTVKGKFQLQKSNQ